MKNGLTDDLVIFDQELYWMGNCYGNVGEILELLRLADDPDSVRLFIHMIGERVMGDYAQIVGKPEKTVDSIRYLEECFGRKDSGFDRRNILKLVYFVLAEEQTFLFDGQSFQTIRELAAYLQGYADQSKRKLQSKVNRLFADNANFIPEFEAWLLNQGFQKEIAAWKERFQSGAPGAFDDYWEQLEEAERERQQQIAEDIRELNVKMDDCGASKQLDRLKKLLQS